MSDRRLADSHLDAAIDRAVREIMIVEPRADLRRRVLAEITDAPARAALWPRLAFVSAAAGAVTLAALLLVQRPGVTPRVGPPAVAPPSSAGRPAAATPDTGPSAEPTVPPRARGGRRPTPQPRAEAGALARAQVVPPIQERRVEAASIALSEAAAEPTPPPSSLRALDPIGIAPIETRATSIREIHIAPVTITTLDITPISPPR